VTTISVVVCDRQPLIRTAIRVLVDEQLRFKVVAETGEYADLVGVVGSTQPDVVLINVDPPHDNAIMTVRRLVESQRQQRTGILALISPGYNRLALAALRAGASGVLLKGTPPDELFAGICAIAGGHGILAPPVVGDLLGLVRPYLPGLRDPHEPPAAQLTPREQEVLRLIAMGYTSTDVAEKLSVSRATERSHVHHVLAKLDLEDRAQLVAYAYRSGLVVSSA
jgi:DNA-binding NarL/FixJ family response regulator